MLNDQRAVGEIGISIATDLGLMGAFGEHPDRPLNYSQLEKENIDIILVNARTLVRNFMNSFEKIEKIKTDNTTYEALIDEMRVMVGYVSSKSEGRVSVGFYFPTYKGIETYLRKANFKGPLTEKQKIANVCELKLLGGIYDLLSKDSRGLTFTEIDCSFKERLNKNVALMTHVPSDLLSYLSFSKLVLLESHTGAIKDRSRWNTKFSTKGLDNIPFTEFTLKVFGDGGYFLSPQSKRIKDAVIAIATSGRWTPLTTEDRIRFSMNLASVLSSDINLRKEVFNLL